MNKVKVSIFCLTYNHVAYIREALDGFLMQKTNFSFNIIVFDDASTDGTSDILREYQKEYPNIIYAYISPVNTYGKMERSEILKDLFDQYLTGKYVAWCEGDDAWNCENKLQMQVDFLEKNAECMMTTHAYKMFDYKENKEISISYGTENRYLSKEEIILLPFGNLATASLVMRKSVFLREEGFPVCDVEDRPMQLYAICHGDIYYFSKEMSIYRYMHEGSWCKGMFENIENFIYHKLGFVDFLLKYNIYTKAQFEGLIWKKVVVDLNFVIAELCTASNAESIIQGVFERSDHIYDSFMEEIIAVYEWMSGRFQMNDQLKKMMDKYKYICIMGKGNYSKYIIQALEKSSTQYVGFVVSKKEEGCEECNVWDVVDYPYDKESTLLIVGINQAHEEDITITLKKHGFKNVWCPLWFNKEVFFHNA